MEEWKEYKLKDIVEINPTESLKKGTALKFLQEVSKNITETTHILSLTKMN